MTGKILLCFHTQDASQLQRLLKKLWQQRLREGAGKGKEAQQGVGGDVSLTWICCWRRLILCCCCRSCCCCLAICEEMAQNKGEIWISIPRAHPQAALTLLSPLNPSWELRDLWGCCCSKGHSIVQEQFIANTRDKGTLMENAGLHLRQGPMQNSYWNGTAKIPQETEQPQQRNQKMVAKGRKSKKRRMARNTLLFGTTCSRSV